MKLRDFLDRVKDLPADTVLCTAEIDEAFAMNVADVEFVENARMRGRQADGTEAVEIGNGTEKVIVIRW